MRNPKIGWSLLPIYFCQIMLSVSGYMKAVEKINKNWSCSTFRISCLHQKQQNWWNFPQIKREIICIIYIFIISYLFSNWEGTQKNENRQGRKGKRPEEIQKDKYKCQKHWKQKEETLSIVSGEDKKIKTQRKEKKQAPKT